MIPRWALAFAGVAALVSTAADASAFCRATSCNEAKTACAKSARGCTTEGTPVAWPTSTLEYRFHDKGTRTLLKTEGRNAIRAAFSTWSDAECPGGRTRLRFVEGEDIDIDPPANLDEPNPTRGLNGIFFRDDGWPHGRGLDALDTKLASTFRVYGDRSLPGKITSARIEINTSESAFHVPDAPEGQRASVDLVSVMVHEVGHFIGIGHSRERDSVMAEALCQGGDRCTLGRLASRRLAEDDVAAVCALYPPGPREPAIVEPGAADAGGCALSGRGPVGGPHAWLVFGVGVCIALVGRRVGARNSPKHMPNHR